MKTEGGEERLEEAREGRRDSGPKCGVHGKVLGLGVLGSERRGASAI